MNLNIKLYQEEECKLQESDIPYQKKNNILYFTMENISHILDFEKKIFIRENEEFCFTLDFSKETCTYKLKEQEINLDINVDFAIWEEEKNNLKLTYSIETEDKKMKIEVNY